MHSVAAFIKTLRIQMKNHNAIDGWSLRKLDTRIVLLPGDGIGPEIIGQARRVLERVGDKFGRVFKFEECLIGGIAIDMTGDPLPQK